jgi:hypothetical protein
MQPHIMESPAANAPWLILHPLNGEDSSVVAAQRAAATPMKGKLAGTGARDLFNGMNKNKPRR